MKHSPEASLEKALARRPAFESTPAEVDIAMSWLRGEISQLQAAAGMDCVPGAVPRKIARGLRTAFTLGKLKEVKSV